MNGALPDNRVPPSANGFLLSTGSRRRFIRRVSSDGPSFLVRHAAALGFGFLRVLAAVMPLEWLQGVGRAGTRAMYALLPALRAALLDNARHLLGPGASERERQTLAIEVLASFSRFAIETCTGHERSARGLF